MFRCIEAARHGSPQAMGQLMEICRQYLLLVANKELNDELRAKGGASDLVQDTFMEAQRDFASFQGGNEEELLAWLRRILLNNVANFTRYYRDTGKRHVHREISLDIGDSAFFRAGDIASEENSPSAFVMASEEQRRLERALARLPTHYARVIELRHQEGRSFAEIGAMMSRSAEAVRKVWSRAIEQLQTELDAERN